MAFDAIMWAKLKNCASLEGGKVPSEQLPSYVDDVIEVASYSKLPQPGEQGKIYYTLDTKESYRWGSTAYILVNSVNKDALAKREDIDTLAAELDSTYAKKKDLDDLATNKSVDEKLAAIEFPNVDLTGYATEDFVKDEISKIEIPNPDLSDYATKEFVKSEIQKAELADKDVDLSNYYTKPEVLELIPDTSSFITNEQLEDAINSVEHPAVDLSGYATEAWVNTQGFLTEHQSLDSYVKDEDLNNALSAYPTTKEVQQIVDNIEIPEVPDLTDYAKRTELENLVTNAQLDLKADEIPFPTENYVVNSEVGGFKVGDPVKNLSIRAILIQLLNLKVADYPEDDPEIPAGPITVENISPLYARQGADDTFVVISRDQSQVITDGTAAAMDLQGIFTDDEGRVGYQLQYNNIDEDCIAKLFIDPNYALTDILVWDGTKWVTSDHEVWIWEESPTTETINVNGKSLEMKVYTYNFDYNDALGSTEYRFVVELAD